MVQREVSFGFESLNEFKTSFPRVGDKFGWLKLIAPKVDLVFSPNKSFILHWKSSNITKVKVFEPFWDSRDVAK